MSDTPPPPLISVVNSFKVSRDETNTSTSSLSTLDLFFEDRRHQSQKKKSRKKMDRQTENIRNGLSEQVAPSVTDSAAAVAIGTGNNCRQPRKIWKVVLTGGPCAGKTTGQARLSTFFENLGWKVYRVPETANTLLSGGINFTDMNEAQAENFQENLLKTMLQIESTFFELADSSNRDVLVICDRGTMDASAYINKCQWEQILDRNNLNEVEIRDNRYNQVLHLVSAADGAESFYTLDDHTCRHESIEEARRRDVLAAEAWVGHPNVTCVDNSSDFEAKINNLISKVVRSIGLDVGDRLWPGARKVKFVVHGPLPDVSSFPSFRDFDVSHDYLRGLGSRGCNQSRLRRRGRNGKFSYTHTLRNLVSGQLIEVKTPLSHRDYLYHLSQKDDCHFTVHKTRRCFLFQNLYLQLDIYRPPLHERCQGMMLLETYTTLSGDELRSKLPPFLDIGLEVTGDPAFSMFNLSLKEDWLAIKDKFCVRMSYTNNTNSNSSSSISSSLVSSSNPSSVQNSERNSIDAGIIFNGNSSGGLEKSSDRNCSNQVSDSTPSEFLIQNCGSCDGGKGSSGDDGPSTKNVAIDDDKENRRSDLNRSTIEGETDGQNQSNDEQREISSNSTIIESFEISQPKSNPSMECIFNPPLTNSVVTLSVDPVDGSEDLMKNTLKCSDTLIKTNLNCDTTRAFGGSDKEEGGGGVSECSPSHNYDNEVNEALLRFDLKKSRQNSGQQSQN